GSGTGAFYRRDWEPPQKDPDRGMVKASLEPDVGMPAAAGECKYPPGKALERGIRWDRPGGGGPFAFGDGPSRGSPCSFYASLREGIYSRRRTGGDRHRSQEGRDARRDFNGG